MPSTDTGQEKLAAPAHDILSEAEGSTADAREGRFYHPELDALRFFAFLLVFIAHCDYDVFDPRWAPQQFIANLC